MQGPARCVLLLLAIAGNVPTAGVSHRDSRTRAVGRVAKRTVVRTLETAGTMLKYASGMLSLHSPHFIYDSTKEGERNRLIDDLWSGEYQSAAGQFSKANPQLVSFFEAQFLDGQEPGRMLQLKAASRFEAVMAALFKARSSKLVTLEAAMLSIQFLHHSVPSVVWQAVTHFSRNVMGRTWAESLCEDALLRDPGPPYKVANGITAAVFDNFMINVGYGSYATVDSSGTKLAMTNWATALLPDAVLPDDWA
jgi:hypothetical protein